MAARRQERSSKRGPKPGARSQVVILLVMVTSALAVLGATLYLVVRDRPQAPVAMPDFSPRLRELAAQRGASGGEVVADQPIRKVEGVFVRSWRISLPNRAALEALEADILAEIGRWRGTATQGPIGPAGARRLRVDFEGEAFDLELTVRQERVASVTVPTLPPAPAPTAAAARPSRRRLAILLDDAGQSSELLERAAALPDNVAVSVLPFLPQTAAIATTMHEAGHEVWLHLPMEPDDYPGSDPGIGAVLVGMSESEIRSAVHSALNQIPHVVGVNNHMGSRATADLRTMTWVMQELKARGMAFVDSRTTRTTVAEAAARAQGVPAARRHTFLDNDRSRPAVERQLAAAIELCRSQGDVLAIGHLVPITIAVLREELPTLSRQGVELVAPSDLVR